MLDWCKCAYMEECYIKVVEGLGTKATDAMHVVLSHTGAKD